MTETEEIKVEEEEPVKKVIGEFTRREKEFLWRDIANMCNSSVHALIWICICHDRVFAKIYLYEAPDSFLGFIKNV